jgi:EF-P beta-lysylation protein EpmB
METRIITRTEPVCQIPGWQNTLAHAFTRVDELLEYLQLDVKRLATGPLSTPAFGLRVPRPFAALIEKGNPDDPILRQLLPGTDETSQVAGYAPDPVGDLETEAIPGLLHKYHGRVLLIASGACGIHCRYCFRRHYPYSDSAAGRDSWKQAIDYIKNARDIDEVILSGGDPLTLSDERLSHLLEALGKIPHLKRLRIHSRLPVVIPERITPALLDALNQSPLQTLLVLHINHAAEISPALGRQTAELKKAGITLLNQSVLLKGVNDQESTLCDLSHALFDADILPYYLHLLDKVSGAAHFEVEDHRAIALHRAISAKLSGYLVPRLVREISGEPCKRPVYKI